ncbi:hypothetical protein TNCV_2889671 [Trichonephila clavipes]|nr:hypothetical protein TNCV_2889671 [Trichonephila clavipes]
MAKRFPEPHVTAHQWSRAFFMSALPACDRWVEQNFYRAPFAKWDHPTSVAVFNCEISIRVLLKESDKYSIQKEKSTDKCHEKALELESQHVIC